MSEAIKKSNKTPPLDVAILHQMLEEKETAHQIVISNYEAKIAIIQQQYESLKHQLHQLLRHQFGTRSERVEYSGQGLLPFEDQEIIEATPDSPETETITYDRKKKKGHGRKAIPDDLPREQIICDLPEDEKACPCGCGKPLRKIGEITSEQLEIIPTKIYVKQFVRIKYAGCSKSDTIITAPMPKQPIDKGLAGPGLLSDILVKKYDDHLPLYRQSEILSRHKIEISRSTLSGWVNQCAFLLAPIVDAMKKEVLKSQKIHTDDTTVQVQDSACPGKTKTGRLWIYLGCGGSSPLCAVYDYSENRKNEWPQRFLKDYEGYLQADAYTGYDILYRAPASGKDTTKTIIEVACMAHARRKFYDVAKASKQPGLAQVAVRYIQKLYKIERKTKDLTDIGRKLIRKRESKPILKEFLSWLETNQPRVLPKSPLGQAIRYSLNQWEALTRYLEHGMLDIDNNKAERLMRPIAVGRKNWLFAGSDQGGRNAAIIYSLIETCKLNKINPYEYLRDVLTRLPTHLAKNIQELTPTNWQAQS